MFSERKMKKYQLLFLLLIPILFTSCRYSKEPKVFSNDKVSIEYPSYLFKSNDIYPEPNCIFQAKNDYRDVYFILVDHGQKPGEKGFEMMCDSILNQLKRNMKEPKIESQDSSFTFNNLNAKEFQISGVLSSEKQDHRFLFVVDVFETTDGHIYQTAGWLLRHKRQLWLKDLQKAAHSLKVKS